MTFAGEIADHYASYRRGFGPEALGFVADRLELGSDALAVDLGCGTGQLAIPLSSRVRHVLGVDPEPDMLAHARDAARREGVAAITSWLLGTDSDVPGLAGLLGGSVVDTLTLSNAAHFVDTRRLANDLPEILTPGGRVGVIANGVPIWCQESAWSEALRVFVTERYSTDLSGSRFTDEPVLARCQEDLEAAGFQTARFRIDLYERVTAEWLLGNLFSAMPVTWIPAPAERAAFAEDFTSALRKAQPTGDFVEDTRVEVLVGRRGCRRIPRSPAHRRVVEQDPG